MRRKTDERKRDLGWADVKRQRELSPGRGRRGGGPRVQRASLEPGSKGGNERKKQRGPLTRTPPTLPRAPVAQPEAEAEDQGGPGAGWDYRAARPGPTPLLSWSNSAHHRPRRRRLCPPRVQRERNRLFQTRWRSAAEKRRTRH